MWSPFSAAVKSNAGFEETTDIETETWHLQVATITDAYGGAAA